MTDDAKNKAQRLATASRAPSARPARGEQSPLTFIRLAGIIERTVVEMVALTSPAATQQMIDHIVEEQILRRASRDELAEIARRLDDADKLGGLA